MADSKKLLIKNADADLQSLSDSGYNLQVAKSVIKNGELMYNLIWQSKVLAPNILIKWKPVYGLNWTSDLPGDGVSVTLLGNWTSCNLGQVLDIDKYGKWTASTSAQVPNYLAVGLNNYNTQGSTPTNGIHIVVGVQGAPGLFDPIFVDPAEIGPGMGASYQPQEKVRWWFEAGMKTASMISSQHTGTEEGDFSVEDPASRSFSKTSSYSFPTGKWTTVAP